MISDRESENKVRKYAEENNYTILANTYGALEYVKYSYDVNRITSFLKWSKGSKIITVSSEGKTKKIEIVNIK